MRKFAVRAVIGMLAFAATMVAGQVQAQAAPAGGCNTYNPGAVWSYAVCISARGNTVYPDFYMYRTDFADNCTVKFYLVKGSGDEKLWSANCKDVLLGHYGPYPRAVSTGPGICYRSKLVITGVSSNRQLSPQVCS